MNFFNPILSVGKIIVFCLFFFIFLPYPCYQFKVIQCKVGSPCPSTGWNLCPSLGSQIYNKIIAQKSTYGPPAEDTTDYQNLSTPNLIDQAYRNNLITAEQRILYLTYAMYEYSSLPDKYHSKVGWFGTATVEEIYDTTNNQDKYCSLSKSTQTELKRLLHNKITCLE